MCHINLRFTYFNYLCKSFACLLTFSISVEVKSVYSLCVAAANCQNGEIPVGLRKHDDDRTDDDDDDDDVNDGFDACDDWSGVSGVGQLAQSRHAACHSSYIKPPTTLLAFCIQKQTLSYFTCFVRSHAKFASVSDVAFKFTW